MGKLDEADQPPDYEALVGVVNPGKSLTVDVEPSSRRSAPSFLMSWTSPPKTQRIGHDDGEERDEGVATRDAPRRGSGP